MTSTSLVERREREKKKRFLCDYLLGLPHLVGLDIAQNGVHISSSKPAGEAFVAFTNMDNALRALEFNRRNMGHRYGKTRARVKKMSIHFLHFDQKIDRIEHFFCILCACFASYSINSPCCSCHPIV